MILRWYRKKEGKRPLEIWRRFECNLLEVSSFKTAEMRAFLLFEFCRKSIFLLLRALKISISTKKRVFYGILIRTLTHVLHKDAKKLFNPKSLKVRRSSYRHTGPNPQLYNYNNDILHRHCSRIAYNPNFQC